MNTEGCLVTLRYVSDRARLCARSAQVGEIAIDLTGYRNDCGVLQAVLDVV
jgi:hypothetical protein